MELFAETDQEPGLREALGVGRGRKGHVDRGGLGLRSQFAQCADQRLPRALRRIRRHQQPPSGRRGERRGDLQLGVIATARALVGVRPTMVEHIFALAVALEIAGRGGDHPARPVLDRDMRRRPARAAANRPGGFERMQEGVGDKRVEPFAVGLLGRLAGRIGAGVPIRRVKGGDRAGDARGEFRAGHCRDCGSVGAPPHPNTGFVAAAKPIAAPQTSSAFEDRAEGAGWAKMEDRRSKAAQKLRLFRREFLFREDVFLAQFRKALDRLDDVLHRRGAAGTPGAAGGRRVLGFARASPARRRRL